MLKENNFFRYLFLHFILVHTIVYKVKLTPINGEKFRFCYQCLLNSFSLDYGWHKKFKGNWKKPRSSRKNSRVAVSASKKLSEAKEVCLHKIKSWNWKVENFELEFYDLHKQFSFLVCSDREEADLLREWFDLMRERSDLRRYEKELLVRAQEVQLEDRHERLQQELRDRLADDGMFIHFII